MVKMHFKVKITEAVLIHRNIVNNYYQLDSRLLYTFIPNKMFPHLLDISPKKLTTIHSKNFIHQSMVY